jgi:phosphosulfolactate phosphohydrolase-like enzyme
MLCESENAQRLMTIPELRADIRFCLRRNVFDVVARMRAGSIVISH